MTPVIPLASRSAAPPNRQGARLGAPTDPIQLHADAHNALAMALHYLRQPGALNVPGVDFHAKLTHHFHLDLTHPCS